jgi:hypothetical protein
VFTRALHWSLSWASSIQSLPSHPISPRSILILSTHLRLGLPSGLFPSGFPTNILYAFLVSPIRTTCPTHLILLRISIYVVNNFGFWIRWIDLLDLHQSQLQIIITVSLIHTIYNHSTLIFSVYFHYSSLAVSWQRFITLSLRINLPITHKFFFWFTATQISNSISSLVWITG